MKRIEEKLQELKIFARQNYVPIVRDETIKMIVKILKESNCKSILEIGTAIGYSGIIMLAFSSSESYLTTIEKNEERYRQAQQNFKDANLLDRASLVLGDAYEELNKLIEDKKKFDFIFLDGPKGQYIKYLPLLKQLLNENGILFADNILLGGLLKNELAITHKNRTMFNNMNKFLSQIQNDCDFETEIYEIDDGFLISKLKKSTD